MERVRSMWERDDSYDLEDNAGSVLAEVPRATREQGKGTGLRFVNFIVDTIVYATILFVVLEIIAGLNRIKIRQLFSPELVSITIITLLAICVHVLYFTIIEASTSGRSVGKLVTGTKAIEVDGNPLSRRSAGLRSLCRLIPLEGMWALWDVPLHDKLTKTRVVRR